MKKMKKKLPKMLALFFVATLMITSIVNIGGSIPVAALDGSINELGVDSTVTYNSNNTSAMLSIDMAGIDNEKYEVKQILGPNGEVLDLTNPKVSVSDNGEYVVKVEYIDKTALVEETSQTLPQNIEKEIEQSLTTEEKKTSVMEEAIVQPETSIETKIKEIALSIFVNRIIKQQGNVQGYANSNTDLSLASIKQNDAIPTAAPRAIGSTDLNEIFDINQATSHDMPLKDTVNINASIVGNKVQYYDAKSGMGTVSSNWGFQEWSTALLIPAKNVVSLKSNWTLKGKVKIPPNAVWWNETGIDLASTENDSISRVSLGVVENGTMIQSATEAFISFDRTMISNETNLFVNETDFTITHTYDDSAGKSTMTITSHGVSKSIDTTRLGANAKLSLRGGVAWLGTQANYPTNIPSYYIFESFQYDNFNPLFEDLKWFDLNGIEVTDDSQVKPGDELTVKAYVRNNSTTSDVIPAKLFLSDDQTLATTKGVDAMGDIVTGVPVNLSKDKQEVTFKVIVKDTIGAISLGLQLEDDFFHAKEYKQVTSKISVGEIFADGTPIYTVMEYQRDASGNIVKDGSGNPKYVESDNQTMLTQDSFVKVAGTIANPRTNETLTTIMKTDFTKVPGLDFKNISDFEIVNGTGTAANITTGLTFNLAANKGTGSFSYIVPVKQNADGTPFNVGDQVIDYTVDGSFLHPTEGLLTGTWLKTDIISSSMVKPIIDINVSLTTTNLTFERAQAFDLLQKTNPLLTFTGTNGANGDLDTITFINQGGTADWKKFGLDGASDTTGTVDGFVPDGTTMQSQVNYNQVILLNGKKHYTRLGLGQTPRTKTGIITLTVNGGIIQPEVYFEIPNSVLLSDQGGIDDTYAGAKMTIGIKDDISTNIVFDVKGDTNFKISNAKQNFLLVSLFNEDKTEMPKAGDKATVGTFDSHNKKKVVWFNALKDNKRTDTKYEGTMTFYITSK